VCKSLLNIIASEMHAYRDRTIACVGFYEKDTATWWDVIRKLWGWEHQEDYDAFMNITYQPPSRNATKEGLLSRNLEPYMKSFEEVHNRVLRICRKSLR
jgi:hypothetical protein